MMLALSRMWTDALVPAAMSCRSPRRGRDSCWFRCAAGDDFRGELFRAR